MGTSLEAITDMDAPTLADRALMARTMARASTGRDRSAELKDMLAGPREESLSSWGMPPPQTRQGKGGLVQENKKLKSQVHVLEHEVEALSSAMQSKLAAGPGTRRSNGARRIKRTFRTQTLAGNRGLPHEAPSESPYYSTSDSDYWKDPYLKPFLHAPYPHDPASSLAHTVTGDYASPATWGDVYRSKETIDWCTENFPWFSDRMKCISKIHHGGPLLD